MSLDKIILALWKDRDFKKYDMHGNLIREFSSIKEASELLNIPACDISNCLHGRQKSAPKNLYVWKL